MPHYKCGACRTRLQIAQPPPAPIVVFCPQCRSALDRVADLTELIGLRRIALVDDLDGTGADLGSFDEPVAFDEPAAAVALLKPSPTP
jgi:hypothetical protein